MFDCVFSGDETPQISFSFKDFYAHNKLISFGRHSLIIVHSNCDSMYTQACIFIYIPWPRSDKPVYIPHNKPLTCIQIRQTQLLTNNKHTVVEYMCYFFPIIITKIPCEGLESCKLHIILSNPTTKISLGMD